MEEDKKINNIELEYRPDIEYEEEYFSDSSEIKTQDVTLEHKYTIIDAIENNININELYLAIIPKEISLVIKETFDIAKDVWDNDISGSTYERIDYDGYEYVEKNEEDNSTEDDDVDDDSFWDPDDDFDIIEKENDEETIIRKEYIKNMTDLLDYYFEGLKDSLSNYIIGTLLCTTKKEKKELEFLSKKILESEKINIKHGNEHLVDVGLKGEISSNAKLDFFSRMCSVDQTMIMFNNFKAITEMRKKYARIDYMNEDSEKSNLNDAMLQGCKHLYSAKYDKTYGELYRYLRGSLSMTSDVLMDDLQSLKAKKTLLDKGGLIS